MCWLLSAFALLPCRRLGVVSSSDSSSSSSNPSDRTGARSSADSLSSIERRRRYLTRAIGVLFGIGVLVQGVYAGREWDEEELRVRKLVCVSFLGSSRMKLKQMD